MKIRRLASTILTAAVKHASPELREWGNAMLREMDFVNSDSAALRWALGGATALFRGFDLPIKDLSDVPARMESLEKKHVDAIGAGTSPASS